MRRFRDSPRRSANLLLNAAVLDRAKELGINLSQTVDRLLAAEVERLYWERWQADQGEAIAQYNERVGREGLLSDRWRTFMRPAAKDQAA